MFRKINNNQQSEPKDENVRQEAQLEGGLNSIQPMGNEAMNVELLNQMLKEANADNNLDLDEYEDQKEEIIPHGSEKIKNGSFPNPIN